MADGIIAKSLLLSHGAHMASIEKRETQDGKTSYRVKVRLKGYPTQSETFERLTDAKKWAQQTESAIREGRHFKTVEAKRHTLAELIDRYTRDVLPGKKDGAHQAAQLAWWREQIGAYTLADITPALIVEHRDKLAAGETYRKTQRSPATVVRYMAALSHAFTIGVKEYQWLDDTPMRKVTKPKEPKGRVRFLSDDERARLMTACKESTSPLLYTVAVLALSTGARQGEVLGLTWDDIDLNRGRAILRDTKNGDTRAIHLSGHCLELLKELSKVRRIDTALLFPGNRHKHKPIDLRAHWEKALQAAKIEDFHFHDLRHSAASYLAMNGATLSEIAEVLGHKTLAMVKRYSHLSDAHVSGVVERMNQKIFG
ncbi:site-specific integrase [Candidatus Methylospira mobilis]|uniref:tyrosine-type recombinase/integrase n=1 Tax=Candidatus Methylospira mobilis TaxID=1808979 RepID=UPI0028E6DCCF|nr:site-specific integrase [Candidatus Methylospira mobilis]WNV04974.1 site-specific integrase [Candidatus Methylospira mobilis]